MKEEIIDSLCDIDIVTYESDISAVESLLHSYQKLYIIQESHELYYQESKVNSSSMIMKTFHFIMKLIEKLIDFIKTKFNKLFRKYQVKNITNTIEKNLSELMEEVISQSDQSQTNLTNNTKLGKLVSPLKCYIKKQKVSDSDETVYAIIYENNSSKKNNVENKGQFVIGEIHVLKNNDIKIAYQIDTKKVVQVFDKVINITDLFYQKMSDDKHNKEKNNENIDKIVTVIDQIEEEITSIMKQKPSTSITLSQIKNDVSKIDTMIGRYRSYRTKIDKKSRDQKTIYNWYQRIGDYEEADQYTNNDSFGKFGNGINNLSRLIESFVSYIHDSLSVIFDFSHKSFQYKHEDISEIARLNSDEIKVIDKLDLNKMTLTPPELKIIHSILVNCNAIKIANLDKDDDNLKLAGVYVTKGNGLLMHRFNKIIENLTRIKLNMIQASDKHNWEEYEKLQKQLFTILGIKNYSTYKIYTSRNESIENKDKQFSLVYYPDNTLKKQNENTRILHFSRTQLTKLNPTHKNKSDGYIYCSFRVYLVMVDMSKISKDTIKSFIRIYGSNIYEYTPKSTDKFYVDTSAVMQGKRSHSGGDAYGNTFTPVFLETNTPIPVKKINLLDLI
jgi:hypothetical protein